MPSFVKFLIGLAAALLVGWLWHGPLGNGAAMVDALDRQAQAVVKDAELPGVAVAMDRAPLARNATLSGPADDFQRDGMGSQPGLTGMVQAVEGMGGVRWADRPDGGSGAMPLLAELLILVSLAYLIGLALGRLLFGRTPRDRFAD
jgi:hypothetical protein